MYFKTVFCMRLCNEVLKFGEVLLKSIVFLGCFLPKIVELIPHCLYSVEWVEHGGKGFCYFLKSFVCCLHILLSMVTDLASSLV